jgi:hypothetical protein
MKRKRWEPASYVIDAATGEAITFEVKRLRYEESEPLRIHLVKALGGIARLIELSREPEDKSQPAKTGAQLQEKASSQSAALADVFSAMPPEIVRAAFRDYVRKVAGIEIEEDDGSTTQVTTGEQLYDFADDGLAHFVIRRLNRYANLGAAEGKGSGSPLTPPSGARESAATFSPAPSIESAAGPSPSTATESSNVESSSAPA